MSKPSPKRIIEAGVCISPDERDALVLATECFGTSQSQYIRQPLIERLVREGFLAHPGQKLAANAAK
jgi:hypothetical protein